MGIMKIYVLTIMYFKVSEEEMRQFPNLKTFVFNMYDSPAPELVEKLRKHGYEVEVNG